MKHLKTFTDVNGYPVVILSSLLVDSQTAYFVDPLNSEIEALTFRNKTHAFDYAQAVTNHVNRKLQKEGAP